MAIAVKPKIKSFQWPKLPNSAQFARAGVVIASSLTVSSLFGAASEQILHHKKNTKHNFAEKTLIGFGQSFFAILSALYVNRGLQEGKIFKLNSWKNALGTFNKQSLALAAIIATFNSFLEWCSELAQKAKPQIAKTINLISLAAKVLGSIGLIKLIGGASLGAFASGCPCCGSPFLVCLADLATLAQSFSQPVYHWLQNAYSKLKSLVQNN